MQLSSSIEDCNCARDESSFNFLALCLVERQAAVFAGGSAKEKSLLYEDFSMQFRIPVANYHISR